MINSEEGRAWLLGVESGFFLDRVLVGPESFETQILVRAPLEIISAVHQGAEMFLWAWLSDTKSQEVLVSTLCIEDDPAASFYLSRAIGSVELPRFILLLKERHTHIIFYDECNRGLLILHVSIADNASLQELIALVNRKIGEPNQAAIVAALDDVELQACRDPQLLKDIRLVRGKETIVNYFRGLGFIPPSHAKERYSKETYLGQDAGNKLEERVAQILRRRFTQEAIFVSPRLYQQQRELCDILIGSGWGYLFLEAKAANVTKEALNRDTKRRVAGIKKQIEKAFRQLEGVRRRVIDPACVGLDCGNHRYEIEGYRHDVLHFGVVVSEIHPDLSDLSSMWEDAIVKAEKYKIAIHLFDPHELETTLNISENEEIFFHNLVHRWDVARERRTLVLHVARMT